jgi:hypothetical protein
MEEKILYRFDASYNDSEEYVRLSKTNIKFLEWLDRNGYLSDDTVFNVIDDLPTIVEF